MPLYEIVLDSGDDQEVRLTDQPPEVGELLELHGTTWEVVAALPSEDGAQRFRAQPVLGG